MTDDTIQIKIGEFVKEHLEKVSEHLKYNSQELKSLQDRSYTKEKLGIEANYSFAKTVQQIIHDNDGARYWKSEYEINGIKYRFCKELGGTQKNTTDTKTRSQREGEKFLEYFNQHKILLDKYQNKQIEFIVGNKKNIHETSVFNAEEISSGLDNSMHDYNSNLVTIFIKNILLYGAPGVGKTHNYQRLISMIENGEDETTIFKTITANNKTDNFDKSTFETIKSEKRLEFVTFHQSYSYEDFIEGFRPNEDGHIELEDGIFKTLANRALENSEKNHYIIIDEINRGNISKIFGELITLIEEDKRDSYEVTLPYSKEKFKIPSNLYIIATMNSTDKSIATMDIALRRRFTFIKMKPNPNLVDDEKAKALMKKLNKYIKDKRGEEYQLGHSYFMNLEGENDLEFVIEYKIKPLLEEYFYGEEIDLDEVIGHAPKS